MRVIIVGGVAGGASGAARLRRLDEEAQILMVERGPYVSYADCGLPYYIGGVIERQSSLVVATTDTLRDTSAIDARTNCEVGGIAAGEKTVRLTDRLTGEVATERYDELVLSPGAAPIRPPLPGIYLPGIFAVRTVPDAFLLDVCHPEELAVGRRPGVASIPVDELRGRLDELPREREILVTCRAGQRACGATRILVQNGFTGRTGAGGMLSHESFAPL